MIILEDGKSGCFWSSLRTNLAQYDMNTGYPVYLARILSINRSHVADVNIDYMLPTGVTMFWVAAHELQNYNVP